MPLEETLTLRDAAIAGIHHSFKEGVMLTRTVIQATFSSDIAETLGYKEILFLENGAPKSNIPALSLDIESSSFLATLESPAELKTWIQIEGNATTNYEVERMDEGVYRLQFWLKTSGDPLPLCEYAHFVASGTSLLKITPTAIQQKLETSEDSKTVEVETDSGEKIPVKGKALRTAQAAMRASHSVRNAVRKAVSQD